MLEQFREDNFWQKKPISVFFSLAFERFFSPKAIKNSDPTQMFFAWLRSGEPLS